MGLNKPKADVIRLDHKAIRKLEDLIKSHPERVGTPCPENKEGWLDILEESYGLPRDVLESGIDQEIAEMASRMITLRLNSELENHLLEEVERMKEEQPYHTVTVSMAIRTLIFEGLKSRAKNREAEESK